MHKLAVAFFYACAILSIPVTVHAVARAEMDKAEFQDLYLKALGVTLGLIRVVREALARRPIERWAPPIQRWWINE
jgi:hypothetical protein